ASASSSPPNSGRESPRPGASDTLRIGQGRLLRLPRSVLMDGHKGWDPGPLRIDLTHDVTRGLWGHHGELAVLGGQNRVEMYVEAVGKHQRLSGGEPLLHRR